MSFKNKSASYNTIVLLLVSTDPHAVASNFAITDGDKVDFQAKLFYRDWSLFLGNVNELFNISKVGYIICKDYFSSVESFKYVSFEFKNHVPPLFHAFI